ncbi:hypothetical protein E6Q11_02790 [Candidatus Dojkabacteria bacterium]|uniref:Uncharacterized protein n=1 Tax=Candidatus Dojkabacteria bacterium TaxID=2099670 RepID=A0A5C7J775_9BACT|nr:MAG: hypothetical protein E6Q11_02790 [Candidatus Dojkabacteria bacterium]
MNDKSLHAALAHLARIRSAPSIAQYRYDMFGARNAGFLDHPQKVIRLFAPDAFDFEPVTIADCWIFRSPEIVDMPDFIIKIPQT